MTREEIEAELKRLLKDGHTIRVDRRTSAALPILLQMERDGLVDSEFIEMYEEQYSVLKFRWKSLGS